MQPQVILIRLSNTVNLMILPIYGETSAFKKEGFTGITFDMSMV